MSNIRFYQEYADDYLYEIKTEYKKKLHEINNEIKFRKNNSTRSKYRCFCSDCNKEFDKYSMSYHLSTKKHLENVNKNKCPEN